MQFEICPLWNIVQNVLHKNSLKSVKKAKDSEKKENIQEVM